MKTIIKCAGIMEFAQELPVYLHWHPILFLCRSFTWQWKERDEKRFEELLYRRFI